MACHSCDAVIENAWNNICIVIDDFESACHAAVEECRVAHNAVNLACIALELESLCHTCACREACAHADTSVAAAESIAADITCKNDGAALGKCIEEASVWAACAKHRWSACCLNFSSLSWGLFAEEAVTEDFRVELVCNRDNILADNFNTHSTNLLFHKRFKLFDDIDLAHFSGKFLDELLWQWICKTELEEGCIFREDFLCVVICSGSCDNAYIALDFHLVEGRSICIFFKVLKAVFKTHMVDLCSCRSCGEFRRAFIRLVSDFNTFTKLNCALGMADACCYAVKNRDIELFGNVISFL